MKAAEVVFILVCADIMYCQVKSHKDLEKRILWRTLKI